MNASAQIEKSWLVDQPSPEPQSELALQVMNIMEQGIIVWSGEGICELHNTRVYDVLEITSDDLAIGTAREDFLKMAAARGEFGQQAHEIATRKFKDSKPFSFDRILPSGRIVSTNARPSREGGYVVTFTDVTEARKMAQDLENAISEAAAAEQRMAEVLNLERARQKEAQLIGQLDEWLQSSKSLAELFNIVAAFMERLLPSSRGELLVYSNSRDVLEAACSWGAMEPAAQIAPDSCWALRRGRSYLYAPEEICFVCEHVEEAAEKHDGAYICVPIIAHGDTVGLLHVNLGDRSTVAGQTEPTELAMWCGEHISMAIANVKLRDELHAQSIRDPLTGLYNRRYFMDAMRREIGKSSGRRQGFGLISFDADHFKRFNDDHGHDAGDMVLQAISEAMLDTLPHEAISCRVGGEEFAAILPGTDRRAAMQITESMRERIAALQVRHMHGVLPKVTISAGVSIYPRNGQTPMDLIKSADQALYKAKGDGRNCVVGSE